jgi:hypothetical protein
VVLDAKYKQHATDIERLGWHDADRTLKERHRNDLMQALAYSTLFDAPKIVTLLVYPCGVDAVPAAGRAGAGPRALPSSDDAAEPLRRAYGRASGGRRAGAGGGVGGGGEGGGLKTSTEPRLTV